jgi:hypothetical protein
MAYGTADRGPRDSMVMGKVTTYPTDRCALQAACGLCARAHRSQRNDQREDQQFRLHFESFNRLDWGVNRAVIIVNLAR